MTTLREAAQQALEALEYYRSGEDYQPTPASEAITALRAALAEPVQEPVAWRTFDGEGGYDYRAYEDNEDYAAEWAKRNPRHVGWVEPLYTAPPQHKPVEAVNKTPAQRRERIAAAALQGVLANSQWLPPDTTWEQIAAYSIRAADALIAELDKPKEQPR